MPISSWRGGVAALAVAALTLTFAAVSQAATLAVSTTADEVTAGDGACSLREAISTANNSGNGDCGTASASPSNTIQLGAATYSLTRAGFDGTNSAGDLDINNGAPLSIVGAGASATTIDGFGGGDRVIEVAVGSAGVTFTGVTITGGRAGGGGTGTAGANGNPGGTGGGGGNASGGGGIWAKSNVTVINSVITGNRAGNGGNGGAGGGGTSNSNGGAGGAGGAGGSGGGIFGENGAAITIAASTVSLNQAGAGGTGGKGGDTGGSAGAGGAGGSGGPGGGVWSNGTLDVTDSAFVSNQAGPGGAGGHGGFGGNLGGGSGNGGNAGFGGGISGAVVSITRSTFAGNTGGAGGRGGTGGDGGAGSPGNGAAGGPGGSGGGGGAVHDAFSLQLTNATLSGNGAGAGGTGGDGGNGSAGSGGNGGNGGSGASGGAVLYTTAGGPSTVRNGTVADSARGSGGPAGSPGAGNSSGGPGAAGSAGAVGGISDTTATLNLENSIVVGSTGSDCGGFATGDHNVAGAGCPGAVGSNAALGPLQGNGGPTQTRALLSGSQALNAANAGNCPTTDQRGVSRPQGGGCDSGAYEVAPPVAATGGATDVGESGATVSGTVTANAGDASVSFEYGPTAAYGSQTGIQHAGGLTAQSVSANLSGLSPGTTYHFRVVAVTADGATAGADATFTTAGTAAPPGAGPIPPTLTALKLSPTVFPAARRGASAIAARRPGTKVTFTLNVAASVRFRVLRQVPGRRVGRRCVKPTRSNRARRRCMRLVSVRGSFSRRGNSGLNSFRFTGRIAGHALPVGRYRLVATPSVAGQAGRPVRAAFRISRR